MTTNGIRINSKVLAFDRKLVVGLCIGTGHIVWANGGFPCGEWPDLKLARDRLLIVFGREKKL